MKYVAPSSVEEATSLLSSSPSAQVFAGATDVVPQLRSGRTAPEVLVDLKKIKELVEVNSDGDKWTVGAATPTAYLTEDESFSHEFPGLSEAAGLIGSDQIQNRTAIDIEKIKTDRDKTAANTNVKLTEAQLRNRNLNLGYDTYG